MLIYLLLQLLSERFILSSRSNVNLIRLIKFKILQPEMLLTSDTRMLILRDNV